MKGAGLFDPHALGVHPRSLSTACWRGFHCLYEVTDAAIGLRELAIGLDAGDAAKAERGELPGLAGAVPEKDQRSGHVYKSLAVKVPFTGGILLADGFIQNLYVHMGFHPAWKYREVHELLFEDGRLLHAQDRSAAMASLRSSRARRRALAATRPARRSSAGSRGPSASTTPGSCRRRSSPRSAATRRPPGGSRCLRTRWHRRSRRLEKPQSYCHQG